MPKALKERIDKERGDVPRSRFIIRKLEEIYGNKHDSIPVTATGKSIASNKSEYNKNKVALQSVRKPSGNANIKVSSVSRKVTQEG